MTQSSQKSIIATYKPQFEENGYLRFYPEGHRLHEMEIDVTHSIINSHTLEGIHELMDDYDNTDDIVRPFVDPEGPFVVRVVDSVENYFGVLSLDEITQEMLDKARTELKDRKTKHQVKLKRITVEEVTVEVEATSHTEAYELAKEMDVSWKQREQTVTESSHQIHV